MLRGKAKKDYQREYMRKRRLKGKVLDPSVRPIDKEIYKFGASPILRPYVDADGNPVYEEG